MSSLTVHADDALVRASLFKAASWGDTASAPFLDEAAINLRAQIEEVTPEYPMRDGLMRAFNSASLRFLLGSVAFAAYSGSTGAVLANSAAALIVLGMNLFSDRSSNAAFAINGIVNVASAAFILSQAFGNFAAHGLSLENWRQALSDWTQLMVGCAYGSWTVADAFLLRMGLKKIETLEPGDKCNPAVPNAIADVLATLSFPPLVATSYMAIRKSREDPIPEDAPVHNRQEFWAKHASANRYLALGMVATGVAGALTGFGALYVGAFALWAWGYTAFEHKRNAAVLPDWNGLKPLKP